jgi:hypothetical protein
MDNILSILCSTKFVKNYILFSGLLSGAFAATYALSYAMHPKILPQLLKNENNNFAITLLNFNIVLGRIPVYFVGGSIIGGGGSIIMPMILPIWIINILRKNN